MTKQDAMRDLFKLPVDLPVPQDDGACDHLAGAVLPDIALESTQGRQVNLRITCQEPTVLFCDPRTGRPDEPAPSDWDLIPGARGCTPQSCAFRDLNADFGEGDARAPRMNALWAADFIMTRRPRRLTGRRRSRNWPPVTLDKARPMPPPRACPTVSWDFERPTAGLGPHSVNAPKSGFQSAQG